MRFRSVRPFAMFAASAIVVGALASPAGARSNDSHRGSSGSIFSREHQNENLWRHHAWQDHDDHAPVVVTNGLNNPRQLSLVDGHVLLIAEAGSGGSDCSGTGRGRDLRRNDRAR